MVKILFIWRFGLQVSEERNGKEYKMYFIFSTIQVTTQNLLLTTLQWVMHVKHNDSSSLMCSDANFLIYNYKCYIHFKKLTKSPKIYNNITE